MKFLRPKQAAEALGIALSTFWKKAKSDPDFPRLISLGPRTTVVEEKDLQTYMQKKTKQVTNSDDRFHQKMATTQAVTQIQTLLAPSLPPKLSVGALVPDWNDVLFQLKNLGWSSQKISSSVGFSASTLKDMKRGSHPAFHKGLLVATLWCGATGKPLSDLPMKASE